MNADPAPGLGRRVIASLWAATVMPYLTLALVVTVARALGVVGRVPIPAMALLSAVAGPLLVYLVPRVAAPLPESLDRWLVATRRGYVVLWAVGGLLAVIALGRMAVFLADPHYVNCSVVPAEPFIVRHSCLTAYVHGAILSRNPSANVYDTAYVEVSSDASLPLPPTAAGFAPFHLDAYGYPPPFLLLPRALLLLTTDFISQRLLFGTASLLLMLFACAATARTLGGVAERRLWLLTPIFMAHPVVLATVQIGNFHLAAVALCLLCWVALEQRRDGWAGTLLAIATLAKIFPGLLGVVLLVQRRWRAVGWTCLAAVVLCALSVAVLGTQVWRDFVFYHLPRVQSGEALRFMAGTTREISFNLAPFGIPFKLGALGFVGWGWAQARRFGDVYSVLLLVLAALAGRNHGSPQHRVSVWLALVMLASLRSPYAGPYVLATVIVLLLVLATELRSARGVAVYLLVIAMFSIMTPPASPWVTVAVSLVRMVPLFGVLLWVLLRREITTPGGSQSQGVGPTS